MRKTFAALTAAALLSATPALAAGADCLPMDEAGAKAYVEKWAAALPGHNPDLVLAFYASGHSIKPHDADAAMTDATSIRDYWMDFVDKTPRATVEEVTAAIDCNVVKKTGKKALSVDGADIPVDFTMTVENRDGTWLITDHVMNSAAN